ncbi:MAG: hypothetical protein ABI073_06840 [Luteolibacter sp.]
MFLTLGTAKSETPQENWALSQWVNWRDSNIKNLLTPTDPEDKPSVVNREKVIQKAAEAYSGVAPILQANPQYFRNDPQLQSNMGNFISFIRSQSVMSDPKHQLGFTVSDQEYWNQISSKMVFPEFLRNKQFLHLMSDAATYEKGIEMLKEYVATLPVAEQWQILPFEAQFIKSIQDGPPSPNQTHGRTYGRMIVMVPNEPLPDGGKMDRWILYSLALPNLSDNAQPDEGTIRAVSMIAVQRPPESAQGQPLKTYFMDFIREENQTTNEITMVPTAMENHSKNCYDCHKSAVLAIRPAAELHFVNGQIARKALLPDEPVTSFLKKTIIRYKRYGIPDWGYLEPATYGPSLGPEINRTNNKEYFTNITQDLNLSSASVDRVMAAMDCSRCHEDFAPINYLQAVPSNRDIGSTFRLGQSMIQTNIERGWMPPPSPLIIPLTNPERVALFRCLTREYCDLSAGTGILVDWLKGKGPLENDVKNIENFLREGPPAHFDFRDNQQEHAQSFVPPVSSAVDQEIQRAKNLTQSGKFQEAAKILWDNHERIRATGMFDESGLWNLEGVHTELRSLYDQWKPSSDVPGLRSLNGLRTGESQD